jgi:hypothetical protein
MNLQLTSIAFEYGQPIPKRHTGDEAQSMGKYQR